ncbi:hypothetical protein [Streptomyces sp. NPDC057052]|uniref:hypothetical protein n=1 Tax=Streptomyces sp. NPDC057052 TaxID=3346010 RepID=UPI003639B150
MSERVADAPPARLERLGTAVDPLVPKRSWSAESTIRRLLARIDADALDRAVGAWLADRQAGGQGLRGLTDRQAGRQGLRGLAVDGYSLRGAAPRTSGSSRGIRCSRGRRAASSRVRSSTGRGTVRARPSCPRASSGRPPAGGCTTAGTRASRSGSAAGSHPLRWPNGPGAACRCCWPSMPGVSRGSRPT